ncbi:MAG: outer membrane protein assembly factor, partial [Chitinophagaceae bacterium]|nr:outer membrane protein assembly factor [Chitinophagaceae bacterium]
MLFAAFPAISQDTSDTIPPTESPSIDTVPTSIDPELLELSTSKVPREYTLGKIRITGTKYLDEQLLVSISGLTTGSKVTIPGGDEFSKAITNLWRQNLFANIQIFFTNVSAGVVDIEINVTERPRLSKYIFRGIRKSDAEELGKKTGLTQGRVVTENTKISAVQAIQKFYTEKGFQSAEVKVEEVPDPTKTNTVTVIFNVNRGPKVRINEINFYGNDNVSDIRLKKQMKGTKEMTKITIHPSENKSTYGENETTSFKEYLKDFGFLSLTKTKEFLDPFFRFKLFSSAKFNETKYNEDKEKVLQYYNSLGFRDASIEADTNYINNRGSLNVDLKVNEGSRYYFGNITWRGNTKYSDSILSLILGIKKGDIYNAKTLNTKLGKEVTAEGGDISNLYQDDGYLFFNVNPIETAVYNDTIDYEIRMVEGPQATIKNITISGNDKTKEHVIRREIRTLPGAKFSRSDLIRSNREIAQLGYFNQEKIGINPVPNPDDGTVDIQ